MYRHQVEFLTLDQTTNSQAMIQKIQEPNGGKSPTSQAARLARLTRA